MAVALIVTNDSAVRRTLPWGARLARAMDVPLLLLRPAKDDKDLAPEAVVLEGAQEPEDGLLRAVREALQSVGAAGPAGDGPPDKAAKADEAAGDEAAGDEASAGQEEARESPRRVEVSMFRIASPQPAEAVARRLSELSVDLLIIPRSGALRGMDAESTLELRLYQQSNCPTMFLRPASRADGEAAADKEGPADAPVLVPTHGAPHDDEALRLAARLSSSEGRPAAALYVEAELGELAPAVGRRIVERIVARSGVPAEADVRTRVVVSNKVERGILEACQEPVELLLMGASEQHLLRRQPVSNLAERLLERSEGPAVAVLRPALPLHHRFRRLVERWITNQLPQLSRDERVALVERLQSSSRWNIDFIALIALSTIIAALGLVRDSPAVIIGAMLVAPLMTPLLGAGLALVQGNRVLMLEAADAVMKGFVLALLISLVLGLLIFHLEPSQQMLSRGSPSVLDLLVAFVSGMAAAYAVGRPNLTSALPGVAIAAALVPPVATAGMAAAIGQWLLAGGATLLFLSNIVAIVLGAAVGLWAVGIRGRHTHGGYERWSWPVVTGLVLATVVLAVFESRPAPRLPQAVLQQLQSQVEQQVSGAHITNTRWLARSHGAPIVEIHLHSPTPPPRELAQKLQATAQQQLSRPVQLRITTQLHLEAGP